MRINKRIEVYTDGGCDNRHNHKNGSWAFALSKTEHKSGRQKDTTNNQMELKAIYEAIKYAKQHYPNQKIVIYSDSQYCTKGFNSWMHSWKRNNWTRSGGELLNKEMWMSLYKIRDGVTLQWVRGHSDNEMNNFVDSLCVN